MSNNLEARRGTWKWSVGIYKDNRYGKKYLCDGVLTAPGVVLTAADCVSGSNSPPLVIRAGVYDRYGENNRRLEFL